MRVDKELNLVVPLEREDGTLYVHSTPIGSEVFDKYFKVISKTFSDITTLGVGFIGGPGIAGNMLKDVATRLGVWDGVDGVQNGLVNEIRRLTNVVVPTEAGWRAVPLEIAQAQGLLSEGELKEAEGIITFFIVTSATCTRKVLQGFLTALEEMWSCQVTSLNCSAFASSLRTSTGTDSSGGTVDT